MPAAPDDRPPTPAGDPTPVALHVRVWNPGAASRVLLLHGLGSDGGTCWRLAEAVAAAGATAVAPDLRGHGLSPTTHDHRVTAYAVDVAQLADAWDLVVGHSLGGAVLAELCTRPGFARRALLLDPALHIPPDEMGQLRSDLRAEVAGALTREQVAADHPGWDEEDRHRKVLAAATVSRRTVDLTLEHTDPFDLRDRVARWTCPVQLVAADPDEGALLRPADLVDAQAAHPGVTTTTVHGAGHSLHRDEPAVVVGLVRDALAA